MGVFAPPLQIVLDKPDVGIKTHSSTEIRQGVIKIHITGMIAVAVIHTSDRTRRGNVGESQL